jgi:hypothetical protein
MASSIIDNVASIGDARLVFHQHWNSVNWGGIFINKVLTQHQRIGAPFVSDYEH